MIGAGGHPDAMYTWADHDTWFDAGAYRAIPQDMIREHAPLLAETLDDLGHAAWLLTAVPGTGGDELRGIPRHSVHQAGAQNMPAIRYDWFEQVGMTASLGIGQDRISTFESKEGVVDVNPIHAPGHFFVSYNTISIPDLEEALERIVSLDPAGEGHTIGMTSSNRVGRTCYHRAWGILCQAYGVSSEPWWVHAGEWFVVRHDVPDWKLARILQIYDWVNFNCEGRLLTQFGVDGEHYTRDGGTICSEDRTDFARDGFVRVTAAGAEQAETNAVGGSMSSPSSTTPWPISWREVQR